MIENSDLKLIYLGPAGTYSEQAAEKFQQRIGKGRLTPARSISEVCQLVVQEKDSCGIVPIENSTAGSVEDTMKALGTIADLCISGEIVVPIKHCLYRQSGSNITTVASKDQAINQCLRYLKKTFPGSRYLPVNSTALAVTMSVEDCNIAAIASENAAKALGLEDRLEKVVGVEDNPLNATRFIVINRSGELINLQGEYKTTISITLPDQPGSLYRILNELYNLEINLTQIKSFGEEDGGVPFLLSLSGHEHDEKMRAALQRFKQHSLKVKIFGSYLKDEYSLPEKSEEPDLSYALAQIKDTLKDDKSKIRDEDIVIFSLQDRIGALRAALNPFASRGINLTQIDSFPTGKLGEYAFYLSFKNHISDRDKLLMELSQTCNRIILVNELI